MRTAAFLADVKALTFEFGKFLFDITAIKDLCKFIFIMQ